MCENVSAFRVFRTHLREAFDDYQTPFVSIDVLLTWATTRFAATTVSFSEALLRRLQTTVSQPLFVTRWT